MAVLSFGFLNAHAQLSSNVLGNGFEVDNSVWDADGSPPQRVASGTNGIPAAAGSYFGAIGSLYANANSFTRWGGYQTDFGTGYVVSQAIYLNVGTAKPNDTRFDWANAISAPDGNHRRDFVFNCGFYNDSDSTGSTSRYVISASNGALRANAYPKNPGRAPYSITTSGWYTFVHRFYDNGSGVLAVDLSIKNAAGTTLKTWTLSDPTDVIGSTVGGHRYGWFALNEFDVLGLDDSRLAQAVIKNTTTNAAYATIQEAVTAAAAGNTISVPTGTYYENVTIDSKNITLESTDGSAVTTISGVGSAALGAILIQGTTTGVTIGGTGKGFTIVGIDNISPGIESAAVYIKGTHSGAQFLDNDIRANGDHGLIAEFGATISNFLIDSNTFSGKTFTGTPDGEGFIIPDTNQFTQPNTPRQLVVLGNGGGASGALATSITFTNNTLTGAAGGINPSGQPQGNSLATLDVANSTITGNSFNGVTTRFGSALRVRRPNTTISGNTFSSAGMSATTSHLFVQNNTTPVQTIVTANTIDRGSCINGGDTVWVSASSAIGAAGSGATVRVLAGSYTENVDASAKTLTLDPAIGAGIVTINGNLTLGAGVTLSMDIAGAVAGTTYDQLRVNGTVTLGGAALSLNGSYVATPGETFTLIVNDNTDTITGTFAGKAEDFVFTDFYGTGVNGRLTYASVDGLGNDVAITKVEPVVQVTGGDLVITDSSGPASDAAVTIKLDGGNLIISDPNNPIQAGPGAIQIDAHTISIPSASVTGAVVFTGSSGDDVFTVDLTGGSPLPPGGLTYNGGTGDDALKIIGNGQTAVYTPSSITPGNGVIAIAGSTITFTGLEPIDYNVPNGNFTLNTPGANDLVTVENGTLIDGVTPALQISGSSGGVDFENVRVRGSAITIDTTTVAGTDTITIASANNAHTNTSLTITAGTESGDVIAVNGITTFPGTTTLNAKTINLNADVTNVVTGTVATTVNVASAAKIQDGVNVVNVTGSIVNVAAGTYVEEVVIPQSVSGLQLRGANAGIHYDGSRVAETIIQGKGATLSPYQYGVITVNGPSNTVDGFRIEMIPPTTPGDFEVGIHSFNSNVTITNNVIVGQGATYLGYGIAVSQESALRPAADNNTVSYNSATNFQNPDGHGLNIGGDFPANNILVSGNNFSSNYNGIYIDRSTGSQIIGNVVDSNLRSGIVDYVTEVTQTATISRNTISNNAVTNLNLYGSQASVTENFISGASDNSIWIRPGDVLASASPTIFNNSISGGTVLLNASANPTTANASGNWWGTNVSGTVLANVSGTVDFSPMLYTGTDITPGVVGFQGDFGGLIVTWEGAQTPPKTRNQEAIDLLAPSGTIYETEIAVEQPLTTDIADGGSKDFGSVALGSFNELTFTIKNVGNYPLTGLGITIDGTDASLFTLTASPTAPVAGLSSTTFKVKFSPVALGDYTAAVHIASNDGNENPFDITLIGHGANSAPTFTIGSNQTVTEDAGPQTVTNFLTNVTVGPPGDVGQTILSRTAVSTDHPEYFSAMSITGSGTGNGDLTYTPAANAYGVAIVRVTVKDSGGTANGGVDESSQDFTITISPINDAPSFVKGADQTTNEDVAVSGVAWATSIAAGPANESSQTVTFHTSNDNPSLFSVAPAITSDGKLSYTPAADQYGRATVTVWLTDDGGTATTPPGVDRSVLPDQTFTITIAPINDRPTFTLKQDQTINEDTLGVQTVSNFLTNVTVGPANEAVGFTPEPFGFVGQTIVSRGISNDNNSLFSVQPALNGSGAGNGDLTYTLAPNATGVATVTVTVTDSGPNNGANNNSRQKTFTITVRNLPEVVTTTATDIRAAHVTLNATVEPQTGPFPTAAVFQYGTDSALTDTVATPVFQTPATTYNSGAGPLAHSSVIYGLKASTTYYFRSVAMNSYGTVFGDIQSFTTTPEQWTWVGGSKGTNATGSYFFIGAEDPTNTPPSRQGAASWTSGGRYWLFGGVSPTSTGNKLNDLWSYGPTQADPSVSGWKWHSGSQTANQLGVYSASGVFNDTNTPGARHTSICWTDASGKLWLFGGFGVSGRHNDLWCFNPALGANGQWAFIKGGPAPDQVGVYGTKGVAAAANRPGGRQGGVGWTDSDGTFWLWGGAGSALVSNTTPIVMNDLWNYNPTTGWWTWVNGPNTTGDAGSYGTQGVASPTNLPPARRDGIGWVDRSGILWLFGGQNAFSGTGFLNDLWKYDPDSGNWTWVKGSNTVNQPAVTGTPGVPDPANTPGARSAGSPVTMPDGSLYMFGGMSSATVFYNDLWKFDWVTQNWSYIRGTNSYGVYGTQGVGAVANTPGNRFTASAFGDATNDAIWVFGGGGLSQSASGRLSDLWRLDFSPVAQYVPDTDADGLDDVWELRYFGNLNRGPNGNPDSDSANNALEEAAGTDPTNAASFPTFTRDISSGLPFVNVSPTRTGVIYYLDSGGAHTPLGKSMLPAGQPGVILDVTRTLLTQPVFRVQLEDTTTVPYP